MKQKKKGYMREQREGVSLTKYFREVAYTSHYCQLVFMRLKPLEAIGEEIHGVDQFFRIESGTGSIIINDTKAEMRTGSLIIVPAGASHNVINTSHTDDLVLISIYTPPHHKDATIHKLKADGMIEHEEFDGSTTE
jgi:mannose-6-phosphate isomerase-like protein (cupin superfamily)